MKPEVTLSRSAYEFSFLSFSLINAKAASPVPKYDSASFGLIPTEIFMHLFFGVSSLHLKFCCSLTSILLPEVVYEQSCLCLVIESVRGNYKQNCFFSIASFRISHFSVNLVLMKGLKEIFRKIQRCIFLQNCPDLVYRTSELRLNRIGQSDFPRRTVSQIGQPINVCAF